MGKPDSEKNKEWWQNGIQFECQGSGQCCVSRDQYGYVYMTKKDRIRMAESLKLSTTDFTKEYCIKEDGIFHLKDGQDGRCHFLKGKKCGVYEGRPTQCRTWPFWPEVMSPKVWKAEVADFCPGIGKGRTWSAEEIKAQLDEQAQSESQY